MTAPDARAEALVAHDERAGYARVAPAILQPAEPFLDLSGEDIRRRMFLTTDPDGRELCLRPDLTIPVSCGYLASPEAGEPLGFCYLAPVFRHRTDGPAEFIQAGIEAFGRRDTAAADALRTLAAEQEVDLSAALDLFESRTGFLAAQGVDVSRIKFSTAFGRGLDYYTGFVFELHDQEMRAGRQLVAGGRYDELLSRLGATTPIPAVGFSVWIERLNEIGAEP